MSAGCGTTMTRSYMPGLFDALKNIPKREPKKFFITVQGEEHEVTLEKKLWAQQHKEEDLILRDGEIVVKPTAKPKTRYSVCLTLTVKSKTSTKEFSRRSRRLTNLRLLHNDAL